jgi:tRNA(fMet)-specific endonuclease VapC
MRVCIDTNVYAALKRGHEQIKRVLEDAEEVIIPAVVLGELYAGFALGTRERTNLAELQQFLRVPGVVVAPVSESVAERYGSLVKALKNQGTPIPTNDLWIAAIAMETGSRLMSLDSHFQRVPALVSIPVDPS